MVVVVQDGSMEAAKQRVAVGRQTHHDPAFASRGVDSPGSTPTAADVVSAAWLGVCAAPIYTADPGNGDFLHCNQQCGSEPWI